MYKSTPGQMQDFLDGVVWRDIKEEIEAWIEEMQESLSDPDGPKDIETICIMRGITKACKNFLKMPEVLVDNMLDDARHDKKDREEEDKKSNWR